MTDATSGAGTAYFSEKLGFTFGFSGIRVVQSLVFLFGDLSTIVCLLVFFFLLDIVLSVRFTASVAPFGIFRLFLLGMSHQNM